MSKRPPCLQTTRAPAPAPAEKTPYIESVTFDRIIDDDYTNGVRHPSAGVSPSRSQGPAFHPSRAACWRLVVCGASRCRGLLSAGRSTHSVMQALLGQGAYSKCNSYQHKGNGNNVACKTIDKQIMRTKVGPGPCLPPRCEPFSAGHSAQLHQCSGRAWGSAGTHRRFTIWVTL